jgi:hypothetical protein
MRQVGAGQPRPAHAGPEGAGERHPLGRSEAFGDQAERAGAGGAVA